MRFIPGFLLFAITAWIFWYLHHGGLEKTQTASARTPASQTPEPELPSFTVTQVPPAAQALDLNSVLGYDEAAQRISRLLSLSADGAQAKSYSRHLAALQVLPSFGNDLINAYDRLSGHAEFSLQRAGLLELMAESNLDRTEVIAHAETEMLTPGNADSSILQVTAHEVFLRAARNDLEKMDGTVKAIAIQKDEAVRQAMFSAFVAQGGQGEDLRDELNRRGIRLNGTAD